MSLPSGWNPAESGRKMKYLTPEEWERFKSVITSPRDLAMFTIAYWRGLRASEIGLLTMDNLELSRWRLRVDRVKHSYGGEYPLSPDERAALKAYLIVRGKEPGILFWSQKGNGRIRRQQVFHLFRQYAIAAGLPIEKRHPHVLKHSIATHLLERGADIMEVKDWLGHKSLSNTIRYAVVTNSKRERIAERMFAAADAERRTLAAKKAYY